ncbi:MAG: FeoB-associated Cys-rich membrane protein [Planctomycetes bacterium]|nr:FeoB-associated Cys-rich membrane protein [Planctomycetota bacterium]
MLLDGIIVAVVVAGAVAYLAWSLIPRRRKAPIACGGCAKSSEHREVSPVRTPGSR